MTSKTIHSGFVTIVGKPNVGKSTLMNALVGEKIAIVSSRPQTTRSRIMGVLTRDDWQMVFLDTPGIHRPRTKLGEYMMDSVRGAMDGTDMLMLLMDASHISEQDRSIAADMGKRSFPKFLVLNKIDLIHPEQLLGIIASFADAGFDAVIPVSAKSGDGLEELVQTLAAKLPEGPQYFPEDMMTDQPERVICAEIVREKALLHLSEEVPHGIGVEIMRILKESDTLTTIDATIYCERESHKGIIIGKQGSMLRVIGSEARADIEKLMDTHINLKLWVKVRPDWRNRKEDLRNLGYEEQK